MAVKFGGAPKGNKNASKGRLWRDALNQELIELVLPNGKQAGSVTAGLRAIAKKVVADAMAGDYRAITEIGIRQDGRAPQDVHLSGEDGGPVNLNTISDLELARRVLFDLHQAERESQREH